jgi:potassium efflux system protein
LIITVLLVLPVPLLLGYLGGVMTGSSLEQSILVAAFGKGLLASSVVFLILRLFQMMCKKNGLFHGHFNWSERSCAVLGKNLGWLMAVEIPAAFVVASSDGFGEAIVRNGLGRLAFFIGAAGLSVFIYRILHPRRGALVELLDHEGLTWRSSILWFPVVVALPAMLAAVAAYGYYETAALIQSRLFTTGWLILLGLTVYGLGMRSVLVAHRRLTLKRTLEKRAKAVAAREAQEGAVASGDATPQSREEPEIELSAVSDQVRTLISLTVIIGVFITLWMVWSRIVPALGVLDEITLWKSTIATGAGGELHVITLSHLLLGILVAFFTIIAARNLPGLLEITTLERLSLDASARYAISTISRYIIVTIGLVIAFDQIGVDWSKMQWIAAAMGVGLGFGLQEVVANFVSGLIILFERPVRIGDTVSVGDISGTVSRIKVRATTITDWDNREVIVPNKDFITGRVINWSLSDPVTRLVLKVGIAYGTDTTTATQLMLGVAKANSLVLDAPPPTVFFLGFGDSSLDFEIRVFVRELGKRMPLMHELHVAVEKVLRENNINIPFPQRDIHIQSPLPAPEPLPAKEAGSKDALGRAHPHGPASP